MDYPLISVIIPTFKREKIIVKRALDSVLAQDYPEIEIIIVDDSPSDFEGREVLEEYLLNIEDNRIKYIKHNKNCGANVARNTGIKLAKGKYIAFLDDDDQWLPTKLREQIRKFNNSLVGLVYSPYLVSINGQEKIKRTIKSGYVFNDLLYSNFIGSTSCVLIKRECLMDVGFFDENLPGAQDYDLYLRLAKKFPIEVVDIPLLIYYAHDGERISNDPYKKLKAGIILYDKYKREIQSNPKIDRRKNLQIAIRYAQIKNSRKKLKYWLRGVRSYPKPSIYLLKMTIKVWFNI